VAVTVGGWVGMGESEWVVVGVGVGVGRCVRYCTHIQFLREFTLAHAYTHTHTHIQKQEALLKGEDVEVNDL